MSKTIVITGANRGIGLELARVYEARGDRVHATCRRASADLSRLGVTIHEGVDVSDTASVQQFAQSLDVDAVDVLVNNAGILDIESLEDFDETRILRQFDVNALGPLRVVRALLPRLPESSKVALITSRMGSIADNESGSAYGYRMSKAALNMAGVSLARDVHSRGIAVGIFHPGMVATDMTKRFGHGPSMQSSDDTAKMLVARIDELDLASSGCFRHANGETLPW